MGMFYPPHPPPHHLNGYGIDPSSPPPRRPYPLGSNGDSRRASTTSQGGGGLEPDGYIPSGNVYPYGIGVPPYPPYPIGGLGALGAWEPPAAEQQHRQPLQDGNSQLLLSEAERAEIEDQRVQKKLDEVRRGAESAGVVVA